MTRALILALLLAPACSRPAPSASPLADASGADASALVELSVRVPAALSVARAIDTLSVAVDPASLGLMQVTPHSGTVVGVEADVLVFPRGQARPVLEQRRAAPGADFGVGASTWMTERNGVPAPGTKYEVEIRFVLFETDVPPGPEWNPRAGKFEVLWTQTLRQAEE